MSSGSKCASAPKGIETAARDPIAQDVANPLESARARPSAARRDLPTPADPASITPRLRFKASATKANSSRRPTRGHEIGIAGESYRQVTHAGRVKLPRAPRPSTTCREMSTFHSRPRREGSILSENVDPKEARRRLPERHARALDLRDQGFDDRAIADSLGVPLAAVGPLLSIAEAKLTRLLTEESSESRHQPEGRKK